MSGKTGGSTLGVQFEDRWTGLFRGLGLDVVGEPGLESGEIAGQGFVLVFVRSKQGQLVLTRPSKIPVPSVATLGATYHSLSLSLVSWSVLVISSGLRSRTVGQYGQERGVFEIPLDWNKHVRPLISCLLANTNRRASFISRSLMILWSSERASSRRAVSLESTTKIKPCVPE